MSEWRNRGYRQWLAYHIVLDESDALSENAEAIAKSGINCEKLLLTLTASYAAMIQRWNITPVDEMNYKIRVFKDLTNAVLALRRAELQQIRLEFERVRLEFLREKQHGKSAASASALVSSSAESAGNSRPEPNPESKRRDAVPPSAHPTAPSLSKTSAGQAPPLASLSPPAEPPAQPMPAAPASAIQAPPRPVPAYRDPRSRYSLA